MEITEGKIGPEASYELEMKEGGLVMMLKYGGADMSASLEVKLPIDQLLTKLKAAIPGGIDDAVIDAIRAGIAK